MRKRTWGLLAAACACSALGQVKQTAGGYLFRARYVTGAVRHYVSLTNALGVNVRTSITFKVVKVKGGIATVQILQSPPTAGPKNVPVGIPRNTTLKLDRENRPIGTKANASIVPLFPAKSVKKGAVWGGTSVFSFGPSAGGALETSYQFTGIQVDRGKRIAMLDVHMRGFATGTGSMLIDCSDGSLLVSVLNLKVRAGPTEEYPVLVQIKRK